jgi:opacity protein-like surface antigen
MRTTILPSLGYACVVLAAASFAGQALADDNDSGPYIGAGYGQFNVKIENIPEVTDVVGNLNTDDSAWKAFFGWRFNKFLSLEGDYIDLGNPRGNFDAAGSDGNYSVELSGFGAYVIGTLPITIFELQAKAGYYWNDVKLNVNFNNAGTSEPIVHSKNSGDAWTYGVGAGITVIDHLNFLLEYEYMDLQKNLKDPYTIWLSAAWRF